MPDIKSSPISEPVLDLDLPDERISDQENEAEDKAEEPKIQRTIVRFYTTCLRPRMLDSNWILKSKALTNVMYIMNYVIIKNNDNTQKVYPCNCSTWFRCKTWLII